jgi:hypothetical protein
MMGGSGYRWMMGGLDAPAWMRGQALPGAMMGTSSNPGKVMGALFANAPGARVSPAEAARLGGQVPAGATASRTQNNIAFSGTSVRFTVLASAAGGRDETFRIAGMTNPTVIVKAGARVSIEVINTDSDTAHGLVVTASGARSSWMPMMTARPAARTCPPTERLQRRSSARKAEWHPAGLPARLGGRLHVRGTDGQAGVGDVHSQPPLVPLGSPSTVCRPLTVWGTSIGRSGAGARDPRPGYGSSSTSGTGRRGVGGTGRP